MKKKYALRTELLERNPQLKSSLWKRALAGPIVMGALVRESDWRRLRVGYYGCPVLIAVFVFNALYPSDMSMLKKSLTLSMAAFFAVAFPLIHALAYGYKHRNEIDTTGGVDADFSWIKRHGPLWMMIGVGVSSGVGIFSWFKLD